MSDDAKSDSTSVTLQAFDSLLHQLEAATDESKQLYRQHIETLVKADFVNITLQLGELHIAFIGKRDGMQSFGAILLQALEKFIEAEIPYSHAEKNDKDIAYG